MFIIDSMMSENKVMNYELETRQLKESLKCSLAHMLDISFSGELI